MDINEAKFFQQQFKFSIKIKNKYSTENHFHSFQTGNTDIVFNVYLFTNNV